MKLADFNSQGSHMASEALRRGILTFVKDRYRREAYLWVGRLPDNAGNY